MNTIILVEDDEKLSSLIQKYMQQQGFQVEIIADGRLATNAILSNQPDVVILDLMLPGKDGLTICREIRSQYKGSVLFLTASEDDIDHVTGIELGADDFIIKPIQPRVLLARVRMQLRKIALIPNKNEQSSSYKVHTVSDLHFGKLSIFTKKRLVTLSDEKIPLTTSEYELLLLLANHAEEVLSRDFIFKATRGIEYDGMDRTVDTKIANLRKKLGDNGSLSSKIITVRSQGYLFVPDSWH
ncbi:response regulator [Pseudoalteromonas denitrificans]|uniref:Two-component system, OmpR family, response regulator RstA n=1 Tax=Pseudoalteromonas denitrificans DSM 6059 TaxID=1123010 RepID=A0A1I1GLC5_9GAMM|nr:response regulator [Pseudoalteromonas denitrificans]SFC12052.1 two-component system, OmpR family, response regulator RstA [Pseudoalteromonas denitrificans DSM 6059]